MSTLVIGATGGIGEAVARALPGERRLSGRNEARLKTLAQELSAPFRAADVGFESHVRALFAADGFGGPDTLDAVVYAAGAAFPEPLTGASAEHTRMVWNANYFGLLWTLKYGLPSLRSGGRVVVIGARPELVTARGFAQYAASKAAAARLLDVARLEHRGVGFTLALPPAVDTPLWAQVGRTPRGALTAGAVARAVAGALADPEAVTELRVDG